MADNISIFGSPRVPRRLQPEPAISRKRQSRKKQQSRPLSIRIVAGQPLIRDLLTEWLNRISGTAELDTVTSTRQLALQLRGEQAALPDLVVIGCPTSSVDEIRAEASHAALLPSGVPVVVVADCEDSGLIVGLLRQGVRGYIPTRLEPDVADAAVRLVLAGGIFVPACVLSSAALADDPPCQRNAESAETGHALGLTPRETEVLMALKDGLSNRRIATTLGISESTVVSHIRNLMRKVGATNRTEAVYMALRRLGAAHSADGADNS